jgi:hypothetical protein
MSAVADLTLDALGARGAGSLPLYAACLRKACESEPPPFGMWWYGEKFRALASDPNWLALSLIQNAQVEGDGSRKLWSLAGRTPDPAIADHVRRHAVDESRHALLYLAMLKVAFPHALDAELSALLVNVSPRYGSHHVPAVLAPSSDDWVLDELIQMNIGEIRTRIHQLLLRPMVHAHATEEARPILQRVLDALLLDETRHIAYTAKLIEAAAVGGKRSYVESVMLQRVHDFNVITIREVGAELFAGE